MYAPFAMLFPEESCRQPLTFKLGRRNPFGLPAGDYEIYDIYPAAQPVPCYDIFLNVTADSAEILATFFCQLDASAHEISLSLSELHLQRANAPALLAAVEAQFSQARGQAWAEILLNRAERMQAVFEHPGPPPVADSGRDDARLLRDEALEMLLSHSHDPLEQERLLETLVSEMRQMMLAELDAHRETLAPATPVNNIIQFPGRRANLWEQVPWLELQIALRDLPEIRRHLRVPASLTLTQLHRVLQAVMGWQDLQPWRFVHPRGEYFSHSLAPRLGQELWDEPDADTAVLGELLQRKGARLDYEYGPAGQWLHQIKVLQRHKPGKIPPYLTVDEGTLACPPEDCRGPEAYRQLQQILAKKRHSQADKRLLADYAGYDPLHFDLAQVCERLEALSQDLQASTSAPDR
ncbi:MAG: hypothetical protein CVV27_04575 [Candidatus Melainabacteria bacterium HGW-Melainabacteria-1]|nr:MAG: hypothetical protein CVV27_04575 [Candidatus Melainabacteria bacterium HGW-Melainabacteria-1]